MEWSKDAESHPQDSKKQHIKAHVDCSHGINDKTILAACLDALGKGNDVDGTLELLHSTIFSKTSENNAAFLRTTRVQQTSSRQHLCIVDDPSLPATSKLKETDGQDSRSNLFQITNVLDAIYNEIECIDYVKSQKLVRWEALPEWVLKTSKCVFSEIFKALANYREEHLVDENDKANSGISNNIASEHTCNTAHESVAYSYIFHVIATLSCLNSLGVREVSSSPMPIICCCKLECFSKADILLANLQRGMEIHPIMTSNFDETTQPVSVLSMAIGLALLRVLTGAWKSRRTNITPMVFQKHGNGVDCADANLKVSIVVGSIDDYSGGNSESALSNAPDDSSSKPSIISREYPVFHFDHVTHLETNLDDISGENLAFAIELLLQNGAIDAWATPIVMKKGRPAHTLHCLCKDDNESHVDGENNKTITTLDALLQLIFIHTSTLGIRIYRRVPRAKLGRSIVTVTTPFVNTSRKGRVDIKVSDFRNGKVVKKKAEFEHCKEIAIETGVGIQVVADEAIKAYCNKSNSRIFTTFSPEQICTRTMASHLTVSPSEKRPYKKRPLSTRSSSHLLPLSPFEKPDITSANLSDVVYTDQPTNYIFKQCKKKKKTGLVSAKPQMSRLKTILGAPLSAIYLDDLRTFASRVGIVARNAKKEVLCERVVEEAMSAKATAEGKIGLSYHLEL